MVSLADVGRERRAAVIVPLAWHRRAELISLVARFVPPEFTVVVEASADDGLVWSAVRAGARQARFRCLVWRDVAQWRGHDLSPEASRERQLREDDDRRAPSACRRG